jgi:hypothetical protein
MEEPRLDQSVKVLARPAQRRAAMRSTGAVGTGLLIMLGLANASAKKKKKAKIGPPGPAGPAGPAGATGPAGPNFASTTVFGLASELGANAEDTANASASCGGAGTVLGCGYEFNGSIAQLLNVFVLAVGPNSAASTCGVSLRRTAGGADAGATVQAIALCKP